MTKALISAAHKSSGKTCVATGLIAALSEQGLQIQPFKKGPDYIDPKWLSKAAGRPCFNLDFNTQEDDEIIQIFDTHRADLNLIEGNKGLYDGVDIEGANSNAALARLLDIPIVLVLDCEGSTRGIAPLLLGYKSFDTKINFLGVILNKVGGTRHESKLRGVVERYTDFSILGCVPRCSEMHLKERHLGLKPANEDSYAEKKIEGIKNIIQNNVSLDIFVELSAKSNKTIKTKPKQKKEYQGLKIGYIFDESFGFYYPDDIESFSHHGAELVAIDALRDSSLPNIDALFIGGGFPEMQMHKLQANVGLRQSIKDAINNGMPTYAECGGLMYLTKSITWNGDTCEMVGVVDAETIMCDRPQGRGYVELETTDKMLWPQHPSGFSFSAHEFHYSMLNMDATKWRYAYKVKRGQGIDGNNDGLIYKNLLASYCHLRDTSRFHWINSFLEFVKTCKN